jgi:N-sulfoglucosamine sulfohydrolase
VVFLGDNGMSFPFAKSNCYQNSTRTPWIVRWPGQVRAGTVDGAHMIAGIDLMPTLLEAIGAELPAGMDGVSFLPLLEGRVQPGRDRVFTMYQVEHGGRPFPMRSIQTPRAGYIFSPWSNGERTFISESLHGRTFLAMQAAAETDPDMAARVHLLMLRVVEEYYD